jgi:hypothetical protein
LKPWSQNKKISQETVAHAYNPRDSGGRDQEDLGLKPAQTNNSRDPILKTAIRKKGAGGVAQGVGPEFKSQYHKKKFLVNTNL